MSLRTPVTIIGTVCKKIASGGVCSNQKDDGSVRLGAPKAVVGQKVTEATNTTASGVSFDRN